MGYLIGIDIGTSSTKVLVIDERGSVITKASCEYPVSVPRPGWAEQEPEGWWSAVRNAIKKALSDPKIKLKDISAVGFSGQMHGTVLIDKELEPLRPAIIWMDKRSSPQCEKIKQKVGVKSLAELVCNPIMPGFMAPSLLWVKENEPKIYAKVHKVMSPKDYVRLKLTEEIATDVSDASATLFFNVRKRKWSDRLLSLLNIPPDLFPEVFESSAIAGEVSEQASRETGLKRGTPVTAGAGDSEAGAIGCGAIKSGIVSSNMGTGGQLFTTIDEVKVDPYCRIHTFCHAIPKKWHFQGAILSAGLSLKWFRDTFKHPEKLIKNFGEFDPYDLLSNEATRAEAGCDGLIFLPYLIGERSPHLDPNARGVFFGLTLEHERAHFIRAVMEGVVYALRDSLEIFKELGVKVDEVIARGGGAKSRLWLQIQADVFNAKVVTVNIKEEAALGAAILAGVGAGVYKDVESACEEIVRVVNEKPPVSEKVKTYEKYYQIYKNIYPSLKQHFSAVS